MTMSVSTEVSLHTAARVPLFCLLESHLQRFTRLVATLGVVGMLIAAGATVVDIVLRALVSGGVVALNEIVSMAFAVAIAACIPAGLAGRVNLKIDILSRWMTGRLAAWLDAFGAISLLVFFALLTQQIALFAGTLASQSRVTVILGLPQAPFMAAVAVLLAIGTLVQAVIAINTLHRAWTFGKSEAGASHPVLTVIVVVLAVMMAALAIVGALNLHTVTRWVAGHPGAAVAIAFGVMWIFMLGQVPLATLTGLIGIVGTALFIGLGPALNTFATEATGLLTNNQIATLPLFLMMGSFAAVSGMADDLYRLAHTAFGRFRGGLALATIGSCAGFGALTGSSLATAVTIGRVAIPEMRERGYSPALATGVCAAGGTLGPLVPPWFRTHHRVRAVD
jgi:C4-dicarboxylate transporter DctM subunit